MERALCCVLDPRSMLLEHKVSWLQSGLFRVFVQILHKSRRPLKVAQRYFLQWQVVKSRKVLVGWLFCWLMSPSGTGYPLYSDGLILCYFPWVSYALPQYYCKIRRVNKVHVRLTMIRFSARNTCLFGFSEILPAIPSRCLSLGCAPTSANSKVL